MRHAVSFNSPGEGTFAIVLDDVRWKMKFHEGEVAVQEKAGVRAMAERIGNSIHSQMPDVAQHWLPKQHLAAATTVAGDGSVWVSLLTGEAGFLEPVDQSTLRIAIAPLDELLQSNLASNAALGLIVLEPSKRERMRLNGTARLDGSELMIRAKQVYSNCPKYIQTRQVVTVEHSRVPTVQTGSTLLEAQRQLIERADTFFIASCYDGNADASHRGGNPGFVQIESETSLSWHEYSGNAMFNTLGNLQQNSHCGLLFVDWESGRALQLTGTTSLKHNGSEIIVQFKLKQWRETENSSPLRWRLEELSPFNPPV
jgi:predicted pyridoxine 5'-phosphate oxidase superfamily flavin-nucleotide-binding protein